MSTNIDIGHGGGDQNSDRMKENLIFIAATPFEKVLQKKFSKNN